jgi:hypothetical protein
MVWEQRQQRALLGLPPMDWIVMRNRLSHIESHNKREIGRLLELLSQRIRFRLAPGFGERVIFRELFPKGLTLLDLRDDAAEFKLSLSHVAARQEVRALLQSLSLPSNGESTSKEAESADNNAVRASRVPSGPRTTGPFRQLSSSPRRRETAPIRLGSANPAAPRGPRPRLTPPCLAERILVSGAKRKLPSTPHLSRR